jgi:hypothetical protein
MNEQLDPKYLVKDQFGFCEADYLALEEELRLEAEYLNNA